MSAVFTPTRYKLSVDDYHKLGEVGILNEDSRVELIEGELIEMAPIGGPHMHIVNRLNRLLVLAVGDLGVVSIQNPVTLPPISEPQPDISILKPGADRLDAGVPLPGNVLLIIEVADTTLSYDRNTKLKIYAKAGIPEVWIINVNARCIEVYRQPVTGKYTQKIEVNSADNVFPFALPSVQLAVAEIFK